MINIRRFVKLSRVHMAHLSDDEFYAKLPLAVMLYVWEEFVDWLKGVFHVESR